MSRWEDRQNRPAYAPDGVISAAWRLVRKGGRLMFAGQWWQHDALMPLVGETVWAAADDYWFTSISAFRGRWHERICCIEQDSKLPGGDE